MLASLLGQKTNIGQYVFDFVFRQLSLPCVHRAEDDSILDGSLQLLVRFQIGTEEVKVCGTHGQRPGVRAVAPSAGAVATQAMSFVDHLAAIDIGGDFLRICKPETGHCRHEKNKEEYPDPTKMHL